ncbi:MAG TPA: hypothetical protein VFB13_17860 [Reyranella sp.]|nr:hypothetical protein [Reyranella sp.]
MEPNVLGEAIAAAARADFDARGLGKVEVPEWAVAGQPTVIYFRPMTISEQFEISSYRSEDGPKYGMVRTIVLKALDSDGKRLFTVEHERVFLEQVSSDVVMRVATAIAKGVPVGEAKKDS